MQIFYTPDIQNNDYALSKEESNHCVKVLRKKQGDKIAMVDGKGNFYTGEITNPNVNKCEVKVVEKIENYEKRNYSIHLAVAPTKNINRFEWFLEKATEIGIDEITPLLCEHSERKVIKTDRLNKILLSAMKQSVKAYMPKLNELMCYSDFVKKTKAESKFIAHCMNNPKASLKTVVADKKDILIMIGPEGDFSPEEVNLALQNGFNEVNLGTSRLRTETAAVVACCTVGVVCG